MASGIQQFLNVNFSVWRSSERMWKDALRMKGFRGAIYLNSDKLYILYKKKAFFGVNSPKIFISRKYAAKRSERRDLSPQGASMHSMLFTRIC